MCADLLTFSISYCRVLVGAALNLHSNGVSREVTDPLLAVSEENHSAPGKDETVSVTILFCFLVPLRAVMSVG